MPYRDLAEHAVALFGAATDEQLAAMAEEVGAGDAASCIADGTYKKFGAAQAKANDIKGTPTVEVNGTRLDLQAGEITQMEALLK